MEQRGLGSRGAFCEMKAGEIGVSLPNLDKVGKLQEALSAKAKRSPGFRFYSLYDKVYRHDVIEAAYRRCEKNGGSAGCDNETFEGIGEYGVERWLGELSEELKQRSYRADAVRRVWIPKSDGKKRPLGIPTIRDRVVQMAVLILLEPIFEADLQPEQYVYRRGKSAHDAIRQIHSLLNTGHVQVVEADISGYFDAIPHQELLRSVARRVSDGQILSLIKAWLVAPVEETDRRGRRHRTALNRKKKRGTPQGAPISPLLSNLYMRRFILAWKVLGYESRLDAHIVNYADDFVICCHSKAEEAMLLVSRIIARMKLELNEQKSGVCSIPQDSFDFLGYTIGRCYSPKTGKTYIGTRPSKRKVMEICREISEMTDRRWILLPASEIVKKINARTTGWSNYFCLGPVSKAYHAVDNHACRRLRQWLCAKHKKHGRGTSRYPDEYMFGTLGLIRQSERTRNFSWAKA